MTIVCGNCGHGVFVVDIVVEQAVVILVCVDCHEVMSGAVVPPQETLDEDAFGNYL